MYTHTTLPSQRRSTDQDGQNESNKRNNKNVILEGIEHRTWTRNTDQVSHELGHEIKHLTKYKLLRKDNKSIENKTKQSHESTEKNRHQPSTPFSMK